ncbi:MAG TPA: MFS transporter [Thermoanaerobaculia bacterium]|nr:MFS transporter [Thermoanaerobaculia bacterium]
MTEVPSRPGSRLVRALRHRNYRLFFGGQTVSLVGTWITRVATSWLVYRLTQSEMLLGVVAFAGQIPLLVLAPFGGVLGDRWNRRRILIITQVCSAVQSLVLAGLALSGHITVAQIIVLQVVQGIINAFDTPARQAFVVEMVDDPEDLPNAIALNSSMFNASRIVGPTIAGILIAAVGEAWCFVLDGVSYIAVILSLLAMRFVARERPRKESHLIDELRVGVKYVLGFAPVGALLLQVTLVSVMGMPYAVLMPVIAAQVLHGSAHTYGILMTASGFGALLGTVYLAARHSVLGLGKVIVFATLMLSAGLIAFSFSRSLLVSVLVLPLVGAGMMLQSAAANTILQTVVDEKLRGRVMAFYTMAVLGTQPLGSLMAGALADRIGASYTILIGAIACVLGGLWFAFRRRRLAQYVRPIYIERGILTWDDGTMEPVDAGQIR